jgi:cytochrome c oxidase subunit 4
MRWIAGCLAASTGLFLLGRYFARPPPKTMTREWQEMQNEYLKVSRSPALFDIRTMTDTIFSTLQAQKTEAITGVSSEGYTGPGMIQSGPSGKSGAELNEADSA